MCIWAGCANTGQGTAPGSFSRVIAAGGLFHVFAPMLNTSNMPTLVRRYESSDAANWTGPLSVGIESFAPPLNDVPSTSPVIFYAAQLLAASGDPSGDWTAAFQL